MELPVKSRKLFHFILKELFPQSEIARETCGLRACCFSDGSRTFSRVTHTRQWLSNTGHTHHEETLLPNKRSSHTCTFTQMHTPKERSSWVRYLSLKQKTSEFKVSSSLDRVRQYNPAPWTKMNCLVQINKVFSIIHSRLFSFIST